MKNIVVVGSQWGDEGKGKIVDWLSEQADVVIRFQGGHNAGHTLVIDGVTYKLRLLPSGIVRKGKISIIGNGVVVDPWALLEEIEEIKTKGVEVNVKNFIISESANLNVKVVNKDVVLFKSIDKKKNYSESGIITRKTGELIHEITRNIKSKNAEKYISIYSCNKHDEKV